MSDSKYKKLKKEFDSNNEEIEDLEKDLIKRKKYYDDDLKDLEKEKEELGEKKYQRKLEDI
jgi:polyhydroxyalkanoate synthesis regulator phasin